MLRYLLASLRDQSVEKWKQVNKSDLAECSVLPFSTPSTTAAFMKLLYTDRNPNTYKNLQRNLGKGEKEVEKEKEKEKSARDVQSEKKQGRGGGNQKGGMVEKEEFGKVVFKWGSFS